MEAGNITQSAPTGAPTLRRRSLGARLTTETKHALKTTEFYAFLAVLAGVLIAGAAIHGAGTDEFRGDEVWLFATILTVGYMISRGLAKSGSREPYWQDSGQNRNKDQADDDRLS